MNTTIVQSNWAPRLRLSVIVVIGALLISGALALSLWERKTSAVTPAIASTTHISMAMERFAALKQAQAEQRENVSAPAPVVVSGVERFAAMKERQAELRQALVAHRVTSKEVSGQERFAAMKGRQAEQVLDAAMGQARAAVGAQASERFAALKQRQLEQRETMRLPVEVQASSRERFATLKQLQAEQREVGIR